MFIPAAAAKDVEFEGFTLFAWYCVRVCVFKRVDCRGSVKITASPSLLNMCGPMEKLSLPPSLSFPVSPWKWTGSIQWMWWMSWSWLSNCAFNVCVCAWVWVWVQKECDVVSDLNVQWKECMFECMRVPVSAQKFACSHVVLPLKCPGLVKKRKEYE